MGDDAGCGSVAMFSREQDSPALSPMCKGSSCWPPSCTGLFTTWQLISLVQTWLVVVSKLFGELLLTIVRSGAPIWNLENMAGDMSTALVLVWYRCFGVVSSAHLLLHGSDRSMASQC